MLGNRLKNVREDNDMSRKRLAELLNVSVHTISSYERNINEPDDEFKVEIAKLFNVSLDYFMGLCDHKYSYNRENRIFVPYTLDDEEIKKIQEYADMVVDLRKYKGVKEEVVL